MRLIATLLAVLVFVGMAYAVLNVPAVGSADLAAVAWIQTHRSAGATAMMLTITTLSGPLATSVYAALLVAMCFLRRRPHLASGVALVVYGGVLLNVGVKHLVHRPRPEAAQAMQSLETYSFPSGHAAAVTVFGALLAALLAGRGAGTTMGVRAAVLLWIVLAGTSRVYLGTHYPSDVAAGVVEGIGWVLLASALLERLHIALAWPAAASSERFRLS